MDLHDVFDVSVIGQILASIRYLIILVQLSYFYIYRSSLPTAKITIIFKITNISNSHYKPWANLKINIIHFFHNVVMTKFTCRNFF